MLLASVTESQRQAFEWANLPVGWGLFVSLAAFAALCYAVVWMYRREARVGASRALRVFLASLRCLILLALGLIWLQPVIATYLVRTVSARVAVLVDSSASMAITDPQAPAGAPTAPRAAQVAQLLTRSDGEWLRRLAQKNDLLVYAFGEEAQPLDVPAAISKPAPGATAPPEWFTNAKIPAGLKNRTDLGQALTTALQDAAGAPIAAIVVISDGVVNKGLSAEDAAQLAARSKAKVHAVGVGELLEPPNIRVTNVTAPTTTPKDDPFEVRVELAGAGIEPTEVELELVAQRIDPAGGTSEEARVATRTVALGGEKAPAPELFRVNPAQAGEYVYRARLARLPEEAIETDNLRETSVMVTDERMRVLLVAGRPSYDYRAVTALLDRDKTIDLSVWLQSADARALREGRTQITELPRKPEELFAYDVVVLMDPNPSDLDSAWAVTVRRLVDEFGGGLLLQAGPHFTSRFLRDARLADLVSILPILPDPDADVRISESGTYRTSPLEFEIPDEARGHPLLALHPDEATNRAVWQALPGAWWYLPVLREKPLAAVPLRVGARTERGRPGGGLLAVQSFGAGRAAWLGFENTWRWRGTAERYFNRFWIQTLRYLAQARRQGFSKRGTITLDHESVNVGEYVKIEARVLDESFAPWHEGVVTAALETPEGQPRAVTLTAIPGREGWFAGRVLCEVEGPAVLRVPLPGAGGESLVKHLRVYRPEIELRTLRLAAESLQRLADESGGRYWRLADAGGLPEAIESASEVTVARGRDDELWDRGWVLTLLASMLALEWALRRRNQLL